MDAQVFGLIRGQFGQIDCQSWQVRSCYSFVQFLVQHVNTDLVFARVSPQVNLCQNLVSKRPSANKMRFLPFFMVNLSTWGLMLVFFSQFSSSHLTSISQSKWLMLHAIASFFICSKCLPVRISLQPVVVTKMLARETASSMVVTS